MTSGNKYHRTIHGLRGGEATVDVYSVLLAFGVADPGRQHAIKKLLCAGIRGKGDEGQDLREARDALDRAIQEAERHEAAEPKPGGFAEHYAFKPGAHRVTVEGGGAVELLGFTTAAVCTGCSKFVSACTCRDVEVTIPADLADKLAREAGTASNSGRLRKGEILDVLGEAVAELGRLREKEHTAYQRSASDERRREEVRAAHKALNALGVKVGHLPGRLAGVMKAERPMPAVTRARLEGELTEARGTIAKVAKALGTDGRGLVGTVQAMAEEARLCLETLAKAGVRASTPSQGARMARGEIEWQRSEIERLNSRLEDYQNPALQTSRD